MTTTKYRLGGYDAEEDARSALDLTRRAGTTAAHEDSPELARMVADRIIDLDYQTWGFGDSVAFEALVRASDKLGDEKWARFAHGWGRGWASRALPYVRLDCTAPGHTLVSLAARYEDAQLLQALKGLADYLMGRPTLDGVYETFAVSPLLQPYGGGALSERENELRLHPPAGVFVDSLHFDPPFLVSLGLATGMHGYTRAGIDQALGYIALLQQENGLFDHFMLRGEPRPYGPGWGRGQGWAVLGLLDVVEGLENHQFDAGDSLTVFRQAIARLIEAMVPLQRNDGHWHAVLADPLSGDEYSTAAFMTTAFSRALALGTVKSEEVRASRDRARAAVLSSLDGQGQLREVSSAVYASTESSHYANVPRGYVVPWGQGPALLALLSN